MNKKKDIKQIFEEEANKVVSKIPKEDLVTTLEELLENQKVLDSLEKAQEELYNSNNQITGENWDYFQRALKEAGKSPKFKEEALAINCKLYCVKQFTKFDFIIPKDIEGILKFEVKKYFARLLTDDVKEFTKELFDLPFEFLSLVIEYTSTTLIPELAKEIAPSQEVADKYFERITTTRDDLIKCINQISTGEQDVLNMANVSLLLQVKAFVKYNSINCGTLEYLVRLFNNKKAQDTLYKQFGQERIEFMREQALAHPSYVMYLKKIRKQEEEPFFTTDGLQNEEREKTFSQFVDEMFAPQDVIPKTPEAQTPEAPEVEPEPLTPTGPEAEKLTPSAGPEIPTTPETKPGEEEIPVT